jgi:hypothetical protein
MSKESNIINCPKCGEEIDVNDILHEQVQGKLQRKFENELATEKAKLRERETELEKERKGILAEVEAQEERVREEVRVEVLAGAKKQEEELRTKISEEQSAAMAILNMELEEKTAKVKDLNQATAELARVKREKDALAGTLKAEAEVEFSQKLLAEGIRIQKEESAKHELKLKDKETQLNVQKEAISEMKRKLEQGSMQAQGEVQELAIEEWLAAEFPLDTIQEIKKGQLGADCLQTINTRTQKNCGTIYYESKRTKAFQPAWIEKFKRDIREKNALIGVLVTEAMPSGMSRLGQIDGVWVCSFDEYKGLSLALRQSIVDLSNAIVAQDNKGDKMSLLYDFMTGSEFRQQLEAIVEGFTQMNEDLNSEQRSMRAIWKKREKQIQKVLGSTIDMYGSIKGISGSEILSVPQLELPGDESSDEVEVAD